MAESASKAATKPVVRKRGAGRPVAGDSEKTKKKIKDAARYCFGEFGFKETSNKLIAERARLTTGTIYHYFENKQDLFRSAHRSTQKRIKEHILPSLECATFLEAMQYFFDASQTLLIEHPSYAKFNAVVRNEMRRNDELKDPNLDKDWLKIYQGITDIGVSTGEIDANDRHAVENVLSLVVFGGTQHSIEANNSNHFEALRSLERLFAADLIKPLK